jgi:hypothetical protein
MERIARPCTMGNNDVQVWESRVVSVAVHNASMLIVFFKVFCSSRPSRHDVTIVSQWALW